MNVIFDCDNTFGVPGCDVDDGLALMYLLGTGKVCLIGITATYGNSTVDITYPNTVKLVRELGRGDIPVLRGAEKPRAGGDGNAPSEAARFLAETASRYAGNVSLLATGSLTNVHDAHRLDPNFFGNLSSISLMGGITAPLVIGGRVLNELNFSCDPEASLCVLGCGRPVSVFTGNHCMDCFFPRSEFDERLAGDRFSRWLHARAAYWFDRERDAFGHGGIYKWDVMAAAALIEPEWFEPGAARISPTLTSLLTGHLLGGGAEHEVCLPRVRDAAAFRRHVYDTYQNIVFQGGFPHDD